MTYDSTRGNASLRHEINNSLTLIFSRLQLLAARYDFLKEDSDFTEIQNDLSDIQRLLNYDRTARQPQLTLCSLQPLLNVLYTSFLPVWQADWEQCEDIRQYAVRAERAKRMYKAH